MKRVRVYIDGFNIYHAIDALKRPQLKWLNHRVLAESFLRKGERLDEVHFFTAVLRWDHAKQKRHVNYLAALRAVDVCVHESRFTKVDRKCRAFGNTCAFHEEKQTDVGIAVKMVTDALLGKVDRLVLLTADSDQIPTAKFLNTLPNIALTLIYPPKRGPLARELGKQILDRDELTAGRLGTCVFPRTVKDGQGKAVAFRPALYEAGA
jgi:uncharacterized LabA/DUF88 family protein